MTVIYTDYFFLDFVTTYS